MSSSDMLQTAMVMNGIGLNDRSFEIIEQPTPTVNKFRFVSELLKKPDQGKPLDERLQLITKKNDGTIYGQSGGKNLQKIRIHSGGYRGMAEIMISAVETTDESSVHPHVIVGGDNVANGPMFVKRIKIEKDSTEVDIRVAIVSTKKGEESRNTLQLIKSAHENYSLYEQGLKYQILQNPDYKYDLNAVRLRFQVKLIDGEVADFLVPVISNPIRIGTLEIKDISDNTAPIQGGKKIIIVCHKLKTERNEKIIPEFAYLDQTENTWFTAPVSRDEASLKSYEGVAISLLTPKVPQTYVKAEIYLTREVDGIVVERSDGWEFSFINDLQELGSISKYLPPPVIEASPVIEVPITQRRPKRQNEEPGILTAEGKTKVGHTTSSIVVEQNNQPSVECLNDPSFIERLMMNPPVDNPPVDNPPLIDVFHMIPSPNDSQSEVSEEPQSSGNFPRCLTEPQSPFSPEEGMRSDGNDVLISGMEEAISSLNSMGLEKK